MNREDILTMPAGREMDMLVHKSVMGFVWVEDRCPVCGWLYEPEHCQPDNCSMRPIPNPRADEPPHYSTYLLDTWRVVEHLREPSEGESDFLQFTDEGTDKGWTVASFWAHHDGNIENCIVTAETFPLAVCRAALLLHLQGNNQ